jgi:hypothetical protein
VSEENKTTEQVELTQEQVQARIKELQAATASFLSDPRHERYQPSAENRQVLEAYLNEHKLDFTADSLHAAFIDLSKESGKLSLYTESKLQPESVKPKSEGNHPPIGVATGENMGIGLTGQQQARRNAPIAGVSRSSNRDAFIRTAQNSTVKVQGRRFHL